MKHAAKEPFPTIYVDVKPDSDAAKAGARYEVIAKAQLKKEAEEARLKRAAGGQEGGEADPAGEGGRGG